MKHMARIMEILTQISEGTTPKVTLKIGSVVKADPLVAKPPSQTSVSPGKEEKWDAQMNNESSGACW